MCAQLKMKDEPNRLDLEKYPHIRTSELLKILKCLPKLNRGGPWVAGGSVWRTINNEELKDCDVDIYFSNALSYEQSCRQMNSYPFVNNVLSEKKTKWNTTFQIHINEGKYDKTIDVQFIGMSYYSRLEKLLNSFDFPVCQFGYDGKDIFMGSKSLADLEKRQISIHKINYPKSSFKHILKYLNNGFVIPPDELKRLVKYMLEMDCWSKNASGKYDDENVKEVVDDYLITEETPILTRHWTPPVTEQNDNTRGCTVQGLGTATVEYRENPNDTAPWVNPHFTTNMTREDANRIIQEYIAPMAEHRQTRPIETWPTEFQQEPTIQTGVFYNNTPAVGYALFDTMNPPMPEERNNNIDRVNDEVTNHNLHGMETVREHRIENVIINNNRNRNTTPVILEEDPWEGYGYNPRPYN